jgi:hypothetical protein
MGDDLVDRIGVLVDHQMAGGEPRSGCNFGDPAYPLCSHCDRHWHGLPITERIAGMYALGRFDDRYLSAEDDSRVLCEGSEFIGPMPSEANAYTYSMPPEWLDQLMSDTASYVAAHIGLVLGPTHPPRSPVRNDRAVPPRLRAGVTTAARPRTAHTESGSMPSAGALRPASVV